MSSVFIVAAILLVWAWRMAWSKWVAPQVHATIAMNRTSVPHGEMATLTVLVENRSTLPVPFVECQVLVPDGVQIFTEDDRGMEPSPKRASFAFSLRRKSLAEVSIHVLFTRRGTYRFQEVSLRLVDGLSGKTHVITTPVWVAMTVHPRVVPHSVTPARNQVVGQAPARRVLSPVSTDWEDLRPYQTGDSLRDIAWKASAKRGELIAMVRGWTVSRERVLVVNVQVKDSWETYASEVETVFEVAFEVAKQLLQEDALLVVYSNAVFGERDSSGHASHQLIRLLGPLTARDAFALGHALGGLPRQHHIPFIPLLEETALRHQAQCEWTIVTAYESDVSKAWAKRMERKGHRVLVNSLGE